MNEAGRASESEQNNAGPSVVVGGGSIPDAGAAPVMAVHPFSVVDVLSTAMRVTRRNLIPFLVLACVLELPSAVLMLSGDPGDTLLSMAIRMITGSLTTAVVTYGVIMEMHGSRPPTRVCIARGFGQLFPVLGITIASGLAIIAAMLLLIIPGVIVALMLYVIVPVVVVEKLGVEAAMKRSRELTNGRKGDLVLIYVLAAVIGMGGYFVSLDMSPELAFAWRTITSALSTMYFAVTSAVTYVVLRGLHDGTQLPEIATAVARIRKA
jgi:hypothetical protein